MEVLATIQHAQMRLGRDFTREEFTKGTVGEHMISEDFDFKVTVSFISPNLPTIPRLLGTRIIFISSLFPEKSRCSALHYKNAPSLPELSGTSAKSRGYFVRTCSNSDYFNF